MAAWARRLWGLALTPVPHLPREALGVVLHKDSKWYQQWKDFRDNNVVFNRECTSHGIG